jgi:hypothetical protein
MTIRLKLVHETEKARLYEWKSGEQLWIPKSVCKSTLKLKSKEGEDIHEIVIEDWWWDKHEKEEEDDNNEQL